MTKPQLRQPTDVHEAFRATVHEYGVQEMAAKIGIPAGSLYNKANLNESSPHKPTLGDAVLVQVVSGDTRIVAAMAHTLGGTFIRLPLPSGVSDAALIEMLCEIRVKDGLFHSEIKRALEDRQFSAAEFKRIHAEAMQYVTAILEAVNRIEGMVRE